MDNHRGRRGERAAGTKQGRGKLGLQARPPVPRLLPLGLPSHLLFSDPVMAGPVETFRGRRRAVPVSAHHG